MADSKEVMVDSKVAATVVGVHRLAAFSQWLIFLE